MNFEKTITMQPGFDKRNSDPSKNYGIAGMTIRFVLRGERGAMQFVVYTDWYPLHVQEELFYKPGRSFQKQPMPADIGYHAYTPQYEDHRPIDKCDILGVPCYYDGTSLGADEFHEQFLEGGSEAVWKMLEGKYIDRFGEEDLKD